MRWAYHKDAAHKPIVTALRAIGATVQALHGKDVPDLLVGYRGKTLLLEVKSAGLEALDKRDGKVRRRSGTLSKGQREWAERWRGGPVAVVHTPEEAIAAVSGRIRPYLAKKGSLKTCAVGRNMDCSDARCPQIRDGEPTKTGRHCPLPHWTDDPEY